MVTGTVIDPAEQTVNEGINRMSAGRAFLHGLRAALRFWPVLLVMWLGALLVGTILMLPLALNLLTLARLPVMAQLADGVDSWLLIDFMAWLSKVQRAGGEPTGELQAGVVSLLLMAGLLPFVGGMVSAFLYGGVIKTFHELPGQLRLGRFLKGCWHWFGGFLLLALFQTLLFVVVLVPFLLLGGLLLSGLGAAGIIAVAALVVLVLLFWLALFELAHVQMVAAGTRNPFRGMGLAFRFVFSRPLTLLAFYGLSVLVWLVVQAVFRLAILPDVPLGVLPLALLAQQGFIIARLFTRAARLAGLAGLS